MVPIFPFIRAGEKSNLGQQGRKAISEIVSPSPIASSLADLIHHVLGSECVPVGGHGMLDIVTSSLDRLNELLTRHHVGFDHGRQRGQKLALQCLIVLLLRLVADEQGEFILLRIHHKVPCIRGAVVGAGVIRR